MSATVPRTRRPASARVPRRRRALAIVATAILAVALCIPKPAGTSASWNDGDFAAATFTAGVPTPSGLTCAPDNSGLLGSFKAITLTWGDAGPGVTYQVGWSTTGGTTFTPIAGSSPPVPQHNPNGTWSVTLQASLLSTLLGTLLDSSSYFSVRATGGGGWLGAWAAPPAKLTFSLLSGGALRGNCSTA